MQVGGCDGGRDCTTPQFGLGVGASLNLNQHLAIDSSYTILLRYDNLRRGLLSTPQGGRASEFLTGPRAEMRTKRYGVFVDSKLGFLSWSSVLTGITFTPAPPPYDYYFSFDYGRRTFFATKLGGGVEYSPKPRVHVRMDMGDLLVRFNDNFKYIFPRETNSCGSGCTYWANNLQMTAGVYFGLGKPMDWTPPPVETSTKHDFFDKSDVAAFSASLLGQAADAITTQRFLSHGVPEGDPLTRPLVKHGWSGQIGLAVLVNGAEISGMYWMHRLHHHRIEHILPLPMAAASGVMAYRNDHVRGNPAQ